MHPVDVQSPIRPRYSFTVPGVPTPKARPRLGRHGVYTPKRTKAYEKKIQTYARQAKVKPIDGAVWVQVSIYFPDRRHRDIDNVVKSVLDALNGIAYTDDSQVSQLTVEKYYDRANPHVCIQLEPAPSLEKLL